MTCNATPPQTKKKKKHHKMIKCKTFGLACAYTMYYTRVNHTWYCHLSINLEEKKLLSLFYFRKKMRMRYKQYVSPFKYSHVYALHSSIWSINPPLVQYLMIWLLFRFPFRSLYFSFSFVLQVHICTRIYIHVGIGN